MFSNGQLIFAGIFVLVFAGILILSYKKDKKLHRKNYSGVKWIGITFISFVLILFLIKHFLKN